MQSKQVHTDIELHEILDLQKQNLRGTSTETVEKEQGFVTVVHTLPVLQEMHRLEPSIIVKDNGVLAGYALTMARECHKLVPELESLFDRLEMIMYDGRPISTYNFYVMGQVCVARTYRGKGVFDLLYNQHKEVFAHKYDLLITDIATRNTRSMRAHERVGFKTIATYRDTLDEWSVVAWDWK